jgi:putative transposase
MIKHAVEELAPLVGTRPACRALGVAPATIYRRRRPVQPATRPRPRPRPARSLSPAEREAVLEVLRSTVAEQLIAQALAQQQITRGQLTLHADRGSSMKSKPVAFLLADLGVTKTHSRPHTSNDNPYSEAQFKTLKYRPGFPERFGSIEVARDFCRPFFDWYNHTHRHSGIGLMAPASVHYGRAGALDGERARVLATAFAANPERFVRGVPVPPALPTAAWINRPSTQEVAR